MSHERTTIQWLNSDLTRAILTMESSASRWWRRRFVTAEVQRVPSTGSDDIPIFQSYADWRFVVGGDRVCDHDDGLAHLVEDHRDRERYRREKAAKLVKLKNPWSEAAVVPPARIVKR